jgi:hypothetical protein
MLNRILNMPDSGFQQVSVACPLIRSVSKPEPLTSFEFRSKLLAEMNGKDN